MTEVKNSSLDLLTRPMPEARKSSDRPVDELSGFKTMIKSRSQKKDDKTPESKEADDEKKDLSKETGPNDAAATVFAAGTQAVQKPAGDLKPAGPGLMQEVLQGPGKLDEKAAGNLAALSGETDKVQTPNPFQPMEKFRFQKLTEKTAEAPSVLQKGGKETSEIGPGINMTAHGTGKEKETIGPGIGLKQGGEKAAVAGPGKELSADKASSKAQITVSDDSKEEMAAALRGKTKEKQPLAVKEEKGQEKTSEAVQEKAHEPIRTINVPSGKEEVVHTTVNAGSPEDLEAKLSEMLAKQISNGKKELDVQLEPYNLGKIRIKVSYEDNQVSVSVLCTESNTLKLLSQSAGDLGTILASNLERPVQIIVDKQEADYLNNQQEQQGRGQQQQQQESRQEDNREDFIQKLRLGIFGTDDSETDYR